MKIAFFVGQFPSLSETFVLAQIVTMIRREHDVDIYAEAPLGHANPTRHADVERYQVLERTTYWPPGAPDAPLRRLASALSLLFRHGWRRPLVALDSLNPFRYGRSAVTLRVLHERLPVELPRRRYDVIHCHFGGNGLRALRCRKIGLIHGPILTTFYGFDANWVPRHHGKHVYRALFADGEAYTVGSEFLRRRIISLGAPPDRIVKLPMGADVTRFPFTPRRKAIGEPMHLLTVARLVEVKGVEYLLRALGIVHAVRSDIQCTIAGDGPLRRDLEGLAQTLGLEKVVTFVGAVSAEEAAGLFHSAHAFVLASIVTAAGEEEGQPIVLAEAQACGLPVVATATGGVPESMRDGESGLLVPERDPNALADALFWLLDHDDQWARMGRAGRHHVEEHYNLERLHERLEGIYTNLLRSDRPLT